MIFIFVFDSAFQLFWFEHHQRYKSYAYYFMGSFFFFVPRHIQFSICTFEFTNTLVKVGFINAFWYHLFVLVKALKIFIRTVWLFLKKLRLYTECGIDSLTIVEIWLCWARYLTFSPFCINVGILTLKVSNFQLVKVYAINTFFSSLETMNRLRRHRYVTYKKTYDIIFMNIFKLIFHGDKEPR